MVIPVCTYMVFLWFFFFPEQYRLHAKQGDAASAGNFSHSHHSTLNELFFCVFWKRFVSNGGLHFTLHTFTRFYEFLGLNLLFCVFLKSFFFEGEAGGFFELGQSGILSLLGNFAHGLSCTWAPFESARCSHNAPGRKKRRFIGEVSTKMGTLYCCGTRRLIKFVSKV